MIQKFIQCLVFLVLILLSFGSSQSTGFDYKVQLILINFSSFFNPFQNFYNLIFLFILLYHMLNLKVHRRMIDYSFNDMRIYKLKFLIYKEDKQSQIIVKIQEIHSRLLQIRNENKEINVN
ncbi:hypothetical protein pb186bvf_017376 [Paramecium bursaria]